jgi:hypothetical protein
MNTKPAFSTRQYCATSCYTVHAWRQRVREAFPLSCALCSRVDVGVWLWFPPETDINRAHGSFAAR